MDDIEKTLLEGAVRFWKVEAKEENKYANELLEKVKELEENIQKLKSKNRVLIPERNENLNMFMSAKVNGFNAGWNACLDEFKRLNKEIFNG